MPAKTKKLLIRLLYSRFQLVGCRTYALTNAKEEYNSVHLKQWME
ncbi:hypothetical protein GGR27_001982 [Lewinella antarctica]|uniref:Uncharacterized protein n=1 Tax=Neolewinella antarctica TaxID=442734 RepID=A0ABX0XB32_9BACT|nr:hypothetical protein [Neolewinella antarctica]